MNKSFLIEMKKAENKTKNYSVRTLVINLEVNKCEDPIFDLKLLRINLNNRNMRSKKRRD